MMFIGSKHCPRCGAAASMPSAEPAEARKCPRCEINMLSLSIGATALRECQKCSGLWVDVKAFEKICADREQQSAVLGAASPAPTNAVNNQSKVKYVPCPECKQLMNRINFARCSGVVVDVCKGHGTWFDRDELSRIIEFIRGGGLEASREREKVEIKEERRRLLDEQRTEARRAMRSFGENDYHRISGIASARGLLRFLLD
jgi:Zn-finger nucleic acid-binding protein